MSNIEPLLFKDLTTEFIYGAQKKPSHDVGQGSYELYLAGDVMFRVNSSKLEPSSNVLVRHAFCLTSIGLFCQPRIHFLVVTKELILRKNKSAGNCGLGHI